MESINSDINHGDIFFSMDTYICDISSRREINFAGHDKYYYFVKKNHVYHWFHHDQICGYTLM